MSQKTTADKYPPRAPSRYLAEKQNRQQQEQQLQQSPQSNNFYEESSGPSSNSAMSTSTLPRQASGDSIGLRQSNSRSGNVTLPVSSSSTSSGLAVQDQVNRVTFKDASIKALIDPTLRVTDVIRQLCANAHLGVQEPPALFALRDEQNDELVDDLNMARKIESGCSFKLCSSPVIEAVEVVEKLSSNDGKLLKMATYTLQRFVREKPFSDEFLKRRGLEILMEVINRLEASNTLAYALASVQHLIESRNTGWQVLDNHFIRKIIYILTTQERINVCRPAAAILKKLVISGPQDVSSIELATEENPEDVAKTFRFGFDVIYAELQQEEAFLQTLTRRLDSADTTLCTYSLSLINSLLQNATDEVLLSFSAELEAVGVSKAVSRLMDSTRGEELSSSILEYQMATIRISKHKLNITVTPTDKRHVSALSFIWTQSRATELSLQDEQGQSTKFKWRRLGFANENVAKDFAQTGWLGLECCESFVRTDPEQFAKIISEQLNRSEMKRCPWGQASLEVVEVLCDYYKITSDYSTAGKFQPMLLSFQRLHYLALTFFFRMWLESGASQSDFARVSTLVQSQVREVLHDEVSSGSFEIESEFLESDYMTVRQRQMRELETEDNYSNKSSIRNLRTRMYRESYEFVRQQRIQCLLEGAWFRNPATNSTFSAATATSNKTSRGALISGLNGIAKSWRFYRLSPNRKFLYFCESNEKVPIRSGLDGLPDRIDLSLVTDISIHSSASQGLNGIGSEATGSINGGDSASSLTFSLMRTPEVSLADLIALNASQFSEWTDGLSMLRNDNGVVNTKETANYIQILTDIGVKMKLLDLTGEQVELPTSVPSAKLPSSTAFFFAEL